MVKSIGIIGLSEGNGHPFSYSAIINGYSYEGLAASGWPGIFHYVRRRHPSEFGLHGWAVTHAWTQDQESTKKLCNACKISHAAQHYLDLLGHVDAVIVARDDYEVHREIAQPFLEAGIPVFIDKPLSLRVEDLHFFKPYLESGQLMSCSGMRYARELDEPRANLADFGELKLIQGSIVLSWEKYGVHLLEAALSMISAKAVSVWAEETNHFSARIRLDNGSVIRMNALGDVSRTFRLDFFGSKSNGTFEILDNFSMFRRMLWSFTHSIEVHQPAIPPECTLQIMQVLIAGQRSRNEGREVRLDEIEL